MSLGKLFLSAVLAEGSVAGMLQYGAIDHLFTGSEKPVYEFIRGFMKQHQVMPQPSTIEAHTGETLVKHKEPASYYHEVLELRFIERELKLGMKAASDLLLPENKDATAALQTMVETVMNLVSQKNQKQVVDFREAYDAIMADYAAKHSSDNTLGLRFGWPTLDEMVGGAVKGDLISFVGRPQKGKTWQMLYSAWYGWQQAGAVAKLDWLAKITSEARSEGKTPALAVTFTLPDGSPVRSGEWVMVPKYVWNERIR